jgi:hypothetical protein
MAKISVRTVWQTGAICLKQEPRLARQALPGGNARITGSGAWLALCKESIGKVCIWACGDALGLKKVVAR